MSRPYKDRQLPQPVRQFLADTIDCLEQLEALVRLVRSDRFWSAAELSAEIGFQPARVEQALESLAGRGLLEVRLGSTVLYRFAPANAGLAVAATLVECYAAAREEVLHPARPQNRALQDFARAFRLRSRTDNNE